MPPNFDQKSKRNKIVLAVVLLVVLVVVVSLLGMNKEGGLSPVANQNSETTISKEEMVRATTASNEPSFTDAELAVMAKSVSGKKGSEPSDAKRAEMEKVLNSN